MKKRIAIQFFGHLRTFGKTHQSFLDNIIKPNEDKYDIDVFIHTWDELEYTALQWHNERIPELRGKKITDDQKTFLYTHYKPTVCEITPQLIEESSDAFPEFTGGMTQYATMRNVWYTKYRVNVLRNQYEKQHNLKYEYVINTRPDILYYKPFSLETVLAVYETLLKGIATPDKKLFYSGYHRDFPVLDMHLLAASDILYFGKPDVINAVSSIYPTLDKEELQNNFISWEHYQIYTAQKYDIEPIQLAYSFGRDWNVLRFSKAMPSTTEQMKNKILHLGGKILKKLA